MSEPKPRPKWTEFIRVCIDEALEIEDYPEDGTQDDLHDEIENAINAILCNEFGHEVIDDHCGIPEHRYCIYCNRLEVDLAPQ